MQPAALSKQVAALREQPQPVTGEELYALGDIGPCEFVVEIVSPTDRWTDISGKIDEYFAIGVEQLWLVEPTKRSVRVYHSPTEIQIFTEREVVKATGTLEGFTLPVAMLFTD